MMICAMVHLSPVFRKFVASVPCKGLALLGMLLVAALAPQPAGAEDFKDELVYTSTIGGSVEDFVAGGSHAYVAQNDEVRVIDLADPRHPRVVGTITLEHRATYMILEGEALYYVRAYGIDVIDISDPQNPRDVPTGVSGGGNAFGISVFGGYMFPQSSGRLVYELSNPLSPRYLVSLYDHGYALDDTAFYTIAASFDGTKAWLARYSADSPTSALLQQVSPGDKSAGFVVSQGNLIFEDGAGKQRKLSEVSASTHVLVTKGYEGVSMTRHGPYVLTGKSGGFTVSKSPGSTESLLLDHSWPKGPEGHAPPSISGDHLYYVEEGVVCMRDLRQKDAPIQNPYVSFGSGAKIQILGKLALLLDGRDRLRIFDASDPAKPKLLSTYPELNVVEDVEFSAEAACVVSSEGFHLLSVDDPIHPQILSTLALPGAPKCLKVSANRQHAYVGSEREGLAVIDLTDPGSPSLERTLTAPGPIVSLALSTSTLFAAAGSAGVITYDVSNPSSPTQIAVFPTTRSCIKVLPSCRGLVVASEGSIQVLDVSVPSSPRALGQCEVEGLALQVVGDFVWVNNVAGLDQVVDISDPASPASEDVDVPDEDLPRRAKQVPYVYTGYVQPYSGGAFYVLQAYDASVPREPRMVASCNVGMRTGPVAVRGDYVYAAGGFDGLQILRHVKR